MKRTYALILAGSLLTVCTLAGCDADTTTGVDTQTTENEVDGRLNDEDEGNITNENISPLDTAENNAAGDTTGTMGTMNGN